MKKKNILSLVLALVLAVVMVVSILPFSAMATIAVEPEFDASEVNTQTGKIETGNPNWGDPEAVGGLPAGQVPEDYEPVPDAIGITTADEFYAMSGAGNYYLAADLTGENAIETAKAGFSGTFDGMGHTIELKGDSLFNAPTNATIKNFTLTGYVTSVYWENTAAVAKQNSTNCNYFNICNYADVKMPTDSKAYKYSTESSGKPDDPATAIDESKKTDGDFRAAAIAGRTRGFCNIERCVNYGYMEGSQYVGGLVSYPSPDKLNNDIEEGQLYIADSYNHGDIYSVWSSAAGISAVISGRGSNVYNGSDYRGHILVNCHNTGDVTSKYGMAAGIIADLTSDVPNTVFKNCTNSGTITAAGRAAGILAQRLDMKHNGYTYFYACVNSGNVTTTGDDAGGFIGYGYGSSPANQYIEARYCVNTGNITAATYAALGIGYCNTDTNIVYKCVFSGTATAATASVLVNTGAVQVNSDFLVDNYVSSAVTNAAMGSGATSGSPQKPSLNDFVTEGRVTLIDPGTELARQATLLTTTTPVALTSAQDFADKITANPFGDYTISGKLDLTTLTATEAYITTNFYGSLVGVTEDAELVVARPVFKKLLASAEIKNLKLSGDVTSSNAHVGALTIIAGGLIENVHNAANVAGNDRAGGIAAYVESTLRINLCTNSGTITADKTNEGDAAGILCHSNQRNTMITHCENTGSVSGTKHAGGIVAEFQIKNANIVDCINRGKVVSSRDNDSVGAGGILGYNGTDVVMLYGCKNYGAVQGWCQIAGIHGDSAKGTIIVNCTNYGPVDHLRKESHNTRSSAGIINHHSDGGIKTLRIENCTNFGDLNCDTSLDAGWGSAGGIAGWIGSTSENMTLTFYNCINVGRVYSRASMAGGIICNYTAGTKATPVNIYGCFNFGEVYSECCKNDSRSAGGLVAYLKTDKTAKITIDHCGNLGNVTSSHMREIGSLIGYNWQDSKNGLVITNTIVGGVITNRIGGVSGVVGYANDSTVNVNNCFFTCVLVDVQAGKGMTPQYTYLVHTGNGAYTTNKEKVHTNIILTAGGYKGTGAVAHTGGGNNSAALTVANKNSSAFTFTEATPAEVFAKLGNNATALGFVAKMGAAHAIAMAKDVPAAQATIVAALRANFGDAASETFDANTVEVYDAAGAPVATVASLSAAAALLQEGYTVKLATEYFGVHDETVTVTGGINWTLDGNGKNVYLFHDYKDGGTRYGFGLNILGNSNLTVKNTNIYANYRAVNLNMDGTVKFLGTGIYAGNVLANGESLTGKNDTALHASTALEIADRNLVVTVGEGSEIANRSNAVINVYGGLIVENGGKVTNNFTSSLMWIQNSMYGLPVILDHANMSTGGLMAAMLYIGTPRNLDVFGGTLSAADQYFAFGHEYSLSRVTVRLFEVDLTTADGSNMASGYNATREGKIDGTPIYGNNGTLEMYSGTLTKATDTDSRMIKYYGSQDFKFYGGTLNNFGKSDVLAFDTQSGASAATVPVTNVIFGNPGGLTLPEGYTVAPLVVNTTHCAFVTDSGNRTALGKALINVTFCGTQESTVVNAATRLVQISNATSPTLNFLGGDLRAEGNGIHISEASGTVNLGAANDPAKFTVTVTGNVKITAGLAGIYTGRARHLNLVVESNNVGTPTIVANTGFDLRHFGSFYVNGLDIDTQGTGILVVNTNEVVIDGIDMVCGLGATEDVTAKYHALYVNSDTAGEGRTPGIVTVNGGTWVNKSAGGSVIMVAGEINNATKVVVNGGTFTGCGASVVAMGAGKTTQDGYGNVTLVAPAYAVVELCGGVFTLTESIAPDAAVIHAGVKGYQGGDGGLGTTLVKGGEFINQSTSAQVVFYGNPYAVLKLEGGKFYANDAQTYFVKGVNPAQPVGDCEPSNPYNDLKIDKQSTKTVTLGGVKYYCWSVFGASNEEIAFVTDRGAQVRLDTGSTGIRFTSTISAEMIAKALTLAGAGGTVSYGTVIAPFDYVEKLNGAFTMEALDNCEALAGVSAKYVNIPAVSGVLVDGEGNAQIRAALTNIKAANYNRKFAAVAYVCVEDAGGVQTYYYGSFDTVSHVRSIKQISGAALDDVRDVMYGAYVHLTTEGKYSRYTADQRATLAGFVA